MSKVEFNPCFSFSFTIVCSFNNTTAMTCAKSHCGSSSCFKYYKHMQEYRLTFLKKYLPHFINTYFWNNLVLTKFFLNIFNLIMLMPSCILQYSTLWKITRKKIHLHKRLWINKLNDYDSFNFFIICTETKKQYSIKFDN